MVYMQYCKNKPTSDAARAEHESFFRQRQTSLGHKLGIEDLLITPVQRFTKYQLLLQVCHSTSSALSLTGIAGSS